MPKSNATIEMEMVNRCIRNAIENLSQPFLVEFFRNNPPLAERCRVAIIEATEDKDYDDIAGEAAAEAQESQAPFPHAEPI